jgi:hypothetical protein
LRARLHLQTLAVLARQERTTSGARGLHG